MMTELVYVPRKLINVWKRRGWDLVFPEEENDALMIKRKWAVLMHPPGWPDNVIEEKKE